MKERLTRFQSKGHLNGVLSTLERHNTLHPSEALLESIEFSHLRISSKDSNVKTTLFSLINSTTL